jgi:hypothetical protein
MPIKPKRIFFTPHTPDPNGVCVDQQTAGAADLDLDGADVTGGVASFHDTATEYGRVGYRLSIESAGDLSLVTFTVTGTDAEGNAQSEDVTGPNATTVESTKYFRTVTSIAVDAAVGTDVEIGPVDEFVTAPFVLDLYSSNTNVAVDISGTISYSLEKCFERLTAGETANWVPGGIATSTADDDAQYTAPTSAVRLVGHSFTGGATVGMNIAQALY